MFGADFISVGGALPGLLGAALLWQTASAQAPVITLEPASHTNYAGATSVFSVAATGAEPLSYAWYFNETNVLAEVNANTLTLTNLQPWQAGAYHVVVSNAEGSATSAVAVLTLLAPRIDLTLGGRDTPDPATTGQNLVYFLGVTNEGPSLATGVRLTDVLPKKLRFSSFLTTQGACSQTNGIVACELGNLSPGQGASVRVVAMTMAGGLVTNQVAVTAQETDSSLTNNVLLQVTTVLNATASFHNPELFTIDEFVASAVAPYPSQTTVSGLTSFVHKVTVTIPAIDHSFPDDLDILLVGPRGQAVMLMSDAGGGAPGVAGVTVTFDDAAPTVVPNAELFSGTYRCANHGNQPAVEEFTNQGNASMPPPAPVYPYGELLSAFNGTDPNGTWLLYVADDSPEGGGWIADGWTLNITTTEPIADLALTQTDSPDPTFVGTTITYRVGLTNHGPAGASSVWLTNNVPSGVQVVSHSITAGSCTNVNGTIGCDVGNLPTGSGVEFMLQVQPLFGGVFSNIATTGSSLVDHVPGNNISIASTTVTPQTDLSLTAASSRNPALLEQPLVYTLVVSNHGPNTATGVRIADTLPPSVALVIANASQGSCSNVNGTINCNLGTLASQGRATVVLTCRPTALGLITNVISVTGEQLDTIVVNNQASVVNQVDPAADLSLTLVDSPDPTPLNGILTYQILVTNRGPSTASNILVSDALPSQVQLVLAQSSQGACTNDAAGRVGCIVPVLGSGERATVTITARTLTLGTVNNMAQVAGSPVDPNSGNNTAVVNTTVVPSADVSVSHALAPSAVWQGDTFTYTLLVSNLGPSAATGVRLTDTLPPSLNLFSVTTSQGSCVNQGQGFACNLGDLPRDNRAIVVVTVFAGTVGSHTNSAVAVGNEQDSDAANNAAAAVTTVVSTSASFANTNAIAMPDRGPAFVYPSTINVVGLTAAVQRVRVVLNSLSHTYPDDLDVLLVAPNGSALPLMSDAGGDFAVSNLVVRFDEAGLAAVPDETRISAGVLLPANYEVVPGEFAAPAPTAPYLPGLGGFRGIDPNGTWSLYALDDSSKDLGSIAGGWRLDFSTRDPIADVSVGVVAVPNPVALGSNAIITVTVSNQGPAFASEVVVTNVFPPSMTFASSIVSQGACTNEAGMVICQLGTLASGSNATVRITVLATEIGNQPVIASGAASQLDLNATNNVATLALPVEEPPVITQQPAPQGLSEGDTAVFTVGATGAEPLTYQWTRNGIPVPDATNPTLIISNVTAAFAGNYRVRVSNRVAAVLSSAARLTVLGPPSISEIEDYVVEEDSASELIVFAVEDVETPVGELVVTGSSSNPSLIPDVNILISGSGTNRTVQVIPAPDQFGTALITVTVADTDFGAASESFLVTVTPMNDLPALYAILDQSTSEDTPASIPFTIDDVDLQYPDLAFFASSSNPEVVGVSAFSVSGEGPERVLSVIPVADRFGATTITLTVMDPSGSSASVSFELRVLSVNDRPFFDPITDLIIAEDSGENLLTITGLTAGATNEPQRLRVSAVSAQPGLLPHPIVEYVSPSATALLKLTPASGTVGTFSVTVTAHDGQAENAPFSRTFNVIVTSVEDPPEIAAIPDLTLPEDTVLNLPLTISDPDGGVETVLLTGISSDQQLVLDAGIQPGGEGANRTVRIVPAPNRVGTTTVTLTATDTNANSGSRSFLLTFSPLNDPPTLDDVSDVAIAEDSGPQSIVLTGITAGGPDETELVTITAMSSDPSLVPDPVVSYSSPSSTATLTVTPTANRTGETLITVNLSDGQLQGQKTFRITVVPGGDPPAIGLINARTELEDTVEIVPITLSDIDTPVGLLTLSAASSNPLLVSDNNLLFEGNGAVRQLFIVPNPDQFGTATITVTASDGLNTSNRDFTVTFTPVNDRPTLNPIPDVVVNAGSGEFSVSLSGITSGAGNEGDAVTLSAVSGNTTLLTVRGVNQSPPRIDLRPAQNASGTAVVSATVTDNGTGNNSLTRQFTVYVKAAANSSPSISDIADRLTLEDTPLTVPFTISDAQTPAASLALNATSSNPNLVPNANLSFGGSPTNRTLIISPAANQSGSTLITVVVTDAGFGMAQDSFVLTVGAANDLPVISNLPDTTITEPETSVALPFTVSDPDVHAALLTVSATSDNLSLVPPGGLLLGGSGTNRMLVVNTIPGESGSAVIRLEVSDGIATRSDLFTLTVNGINELPTISSISDQQTDEDTATGPISFQVNDLETAASSLVVTAISSNPALVPSDNLILTGTGVDRALIITPLTNEFGAGNVTIRVRDALGAEASTTFTLVVSPVNEAPSVDPLPDVFINQDGPPVAVPFTGVKSGATNENDVLLVTAVSGNLNLIAPPVVTYSSPEVSGSLTLTPVAGAHGETTVTVIVNDGQASNHLVTNSFRVLVNPAPVVADIPDQLVLEESGELRVPFVISDDSTSPEELMVFVSSSNQALVPDSNLALGGLDANRVVSLTPVTNGAGSTLITLIVVDTNGAARSASFEVVVLGINDLPELSVFQDRVIDEDTAIAELPFQVNDVETPLDALTVVGASSNPSLVPPGHIVISGSGGSRFLAVTPAPDQFGEAIITVMVTDVDGGTAAQSFKLSVNPVHDPLTFSAVPDQSTLEDQIVIVPLDIVRPPAGLLTFSVSSGSQELVPNTNLVVTMDGTNAFLQITPAADQFGTNSITITAATADTSVTRGFTLGVAAVNDAPRFNPPLGDLATFEDTPLALPLAVSDPENPASALLIELSTSNPGLASVVLAGEGGSRTLQITPAPDQYGTAAIEIRARDGAGEWGTNAFSLSVIPVEEPPIISALPEQAIQEDGELVLEFTVVDDDEPASGLIVTASSSNADLLRNEALFLETAGDLRRLRLRPEPNQFGSSSVILSVQDASSNLVSTSFLLTVEPVNDLPQVIGLVNLETTIGQPVSNAFTVSDVETPVAFLTYVADSTNLALVSADNIKVDRADTNWTVQVTPNTDQFGYAVITLLVTDSDGGTSTNAFELLVHQAGAPVIARHPQTQTVTGGPVILRVIATGTAPLTYEWLKDGVTLPGATGSTFALTNASRADSGDYRVIVSNGEGSVSSLIATLRVLDVPTILGISRRPSGTELRFRGVTGQRYIIEYQDHLGSGEWSTLMELDGDESTLTVLDPQVSVPMRFYRIRVD